MARYSVNNYTVETLLSNIKSGSIAIPEMQRPFVWDSSKVRDLVDSLYKGFPVGYIIVWQNPDVKLKDGTKSSGKKVLIDGQQRITAMAAAIVGQEVLDDHYKWKRISIAITPCAAEHPMSFKVPDKLLTDGQCRMMINGIQFIQVLLEANGLAAGKDHQFKGRYDAEKNAVIISLETDEQSALSPQKCTT